MRFLCDEMVGRLGRWLRAAGYDTVVAARGSEDAALLAQALAEGRILLTRDRALARAARFEGVAAPALGEGLEAEVASLEPLGVDWTLAPFTRCVVDNTPLQPASEAQIAAMPGETAGSPGPLRACSACGRLYWQGSHVGRMRERLEGWAERSG